MGYRSDIAFELKKETNDLFQAIYAAKFPEDLSWLYDNIQQESEDGTLYCWECIKWYDSYPEVSFITKFISELDENDYRFVRIGEEHDDNETGGYSEVFNLNIHRSIHWE
jgi:hypothetical protein